MLVGLNAREPKEQSSAYARRRTGSISRSPEEPVWGVVLGSVACPRHSIVADWAQRVGDICSFFFWWKTSNARLKTLLIFIDNGKMFAGVQNGI